MVKVRLGVGLDIVRVTSTMHDSSGLPVCILCVYLTTTFFILFCQLASFRLAVLI